MQNWQEYLEELSTCFYLDTMLCLGKILEDIFQTYFAKIFFKFECC